MRGEFKLPSKVSGGKPGKPSIPSKSVLDNDVYASPYEVRVRPPTAFVPSVAQQPKVNDQAKSEESSDEESVSKLTILRLRRSASLQAADDSLPVLSEKDAQLLSRIFH